MDLIGPLVCIPELWVFKDLDYSSLGLILNEVEYIFVHRCLSLKMSGSLDACGTENLPFSGFMLALGSSTSSGTSFPKACGSESIILLISSDWLA